jgi:UDP-N-acetylglucosamine 2-epimerase
MKVLSIVGARPEFVQAAPVSRALRQRHQEILVHTGQHYDYRMSQLFFQELSLPDPDYNLGAGSGSHGRQTGEMLTALEEVMVTERPDWVIVRGDTNSTLAGALAAAKLRLPLAHIEAGERSFDRSMPEEINRVVADRVADLLLCISPTAPDNLAAEGLTAGVHWVGDVMLDALVTLAPVAAKHSTILARMGLRVGEYVLCTVHRAANTDDPRRLRQIVTALNQIPRTVVLPVHPRAQRALDELDLHFEPNVLAVPAVGYLDMLALERSADAIVTDSGGVTREAYFLGVRCITLREETEHIGTVRAGWNLLVGTAPDRVLQALREFRPTTNRPPLFGNGNAASAIVRVLEETTSGARGMGTEYAAQAPLPSARL